MCVCFIQVFDKTATGSKIRPGVDGVTVKITLVKNQGTPRITVNRLIAHACLENRKLLRHCSCYLDDYRANFILKSTHQNTEHCSDICLCLRFIMGLHHSLRQIEKRSLLKPVSFLPANILLTCLNLQLLLLLHL